jgi:hypothetical protein
MSLKAPGFNPSTYKVKKTGFKVCFFEIPTCAVTQCGRAFGGWWEEVGERSVGREMPEVNGQLTKTK